MKTNLQLLKNTQKFRKTKKGVLTNIYQHQKARMRVDYTLNQLQSMFLNNKKFNRLFNEWKNHQYDKQFKPSIDRINCKKHYSINNIQCLTWAENRYKQTMERRVRKGQVNMVFGDKIIKTFNSQREAVIETGICQSCISAVLNNRRKYAGGYKWIYSNPELLKGGDVYGKF